MNISVNLRFLSKQLPGSVKLVAVSKNHPADDIMQAYEAGHKIFGENKAQELASKAARLPEDIEWHFIGHLQTNKVRTIIPFVHTIESVESKRLLTIINREASGQNRVIDCLLQFHIASELSKFGLDMDEAHAILKSTDFTEMKNIHITGVMGMATFTDDEAEIRSEFRKLRSYFDQLKTLYFKDDPSFCEISMGMSGDYLLAIEEGSTMVRIGSAIFG